MVYRKFQDIEISGLGFGAMRLPVIDGKEDQIDEEAAREMVAYGIEHGVNYFDTAWGYHGEQSEIVMGRILADYPRESFYLATKFPGYNPDNIRAGMGKEIFERQLEKCQVDYFDFYMFHNVNETNIDLYLDDENNGLFSYLLEQRENGRIRHLGFSEHGDYDVVKRFLEARGDQLEFCQIQLNWVDYEYQDAQRRVELLNEYGMPIWVMEPLRGGKLAVLPDKYAKRVESLRPNETIPGMAFRFVQTFPQVVVTLSGMSDMEQVKQNVEIFQTEEPLNAHEFNTLVEVADEMKEEMTVPCTECRYCTSHCPQEINIPWILSMYNDRALGGSELIVPGWFLGSTPEGQRPEACLACGSCETVCPQGIKISEVMEKFSKAIVP